MINESPETTARRRRIKAARRAGKTWPEIADAEGVTVTRLHQIVAGNPTAPNPDGKPVAYPCAACGRTFTATTKWPPSRCRLCKSSNWKGAVVTAVALVLSLLGCTARADDRPNVVVFVLDDATEAIVTPRLAAIAGEGVRFSAVAPSPLCAPARASILTGRHTHNHGVRGNLGGAEAWRERAQGNVLPDWFGAAGYVTARFGKGINDVPRPALGFQIGVNPVHSPGDPGGVRYLTDRAVELVEQTTAPLLIYFAPVHDWSNPAPEYFGTADDAELPRPPNFNELDVSDKRWKVPALLLTDEQVAAIETRHRRALESMESLVDSIERLRAAFEGRPLVLVVVSDHGHQDGQHRVFSGKGRHFEESIRMPLFILGPGIEPGESPALVYGLDIAPTVAELAGVAVPELDGRSLVPLLADPSAPWRRRVLLEHGYRGVRTLNRKLVIKGSQRELYNLTKDPWELRNRCAVGDDACGSALEPYISELAACRGAGCWEIETRRKKGGQP